MGSEMCIRDSLKGSAGIWYDGLSHQIKTDWDEFVAAFKEAYLMPRIFAADQKKAFNLRDMQPGETPSDYASVLRRLMQDTISQEEQAYKAIPDPVQSRAMLNSLKERVEREIKDRFINGLPTSGSNVRGQLLEKDGDGNLTVAAAVQAAQNLLPTDQLLSAKTNTDTDYILSLIHI